MSDACIWLVVGLGNPGSRYAVTRHNAGFMVLDCLASRIASGASWSEPDGVPAMLLSCKLENVDIVLAKPLTYMNSSGVAVQIVMSRIGATTRSLILVSDDADLPLGRIRLRSKGGSGGHHGVRSIIEATGTGDFLRLRMGIGRPSKAADLAVYVLDKVTDCERITLEKSVQRAAEAVLATIRAGIQAAMNIYNAPLVEQAC